MAYNEPDSAVIIPLPAKIRRKEGVFAITPSTVILADAVNRQNALYLRDLLAPPTGFDLPVRSDVSASDSVIHLKSGGDRELLGQEGYTLDISPDAVCIEAPETSGIFYGIQTLRQLLPSAIEKRVLVRKIPWQVPCVTIQDRPRFKWRGHMLDEGRHFQGKESVLRTLDLMALQKLNVFHWHLTEDQGWRVEIKTYPKLTEIGSVRRGTARGFVGKHDGIPHGGFYTQDDIQEIVAYAAQRHITIVPEIETPGHSKAALAAYPELSCTGGPFEVATHFAPKQDVFCAGKEAVFTFLQNVLDEVMGLFPSPFIHIGGDEVLKGRWKKCPDCQRRIVQEGLKNEHALQTYFINRISAYLADHGRRAVGWNEILHDELHEGAVVQYWIRKRKKVIEAILGGRDVIVSPYFHVYLDHSHSLTPLSKAYNFEPAFPGLSATEARHVLGLEAPLWTEFVPNQARLDYQTYPRLTAIAETGWSQKERKDYADFRRRLSVLLERLDTLGVKYAPREALEPPWFKRLFGVFTIARPQTQIAP